MEGTLSRVKSAIDEYEEARLKEQLQSDLVSITGEFQMMQSSFLVVVSAERAGNQRDLAFDVDGCVSSSSTSTPVRAGPGCGAPPPPLDQAVAEIRLLKARVEEVSQRNPPATR